MKLKNKNWVGRVCKAKKKHNSGLIKFFLQEVKGRVGQDSERRIICYPGDFEDTKFIRELKENETILLPPKSRLKTLSREELAFLYHRYTSLQNFQGWSKPIKRQKKQTTKLRLQIFEKLSV